MPTKPSPERVFLGRYQSVRLLGEGGMALVFLAREQGSDKQVVVKIMQERFRTDAKCREAFRREMDFMANFRHPHAVGFHAASLNDPQGPCIVMEYVQGVPLDDLLKKHGRLPPPRVGLLLGQLCMVLQALHEQQYIHRDLKTGNIMVLDADRRTESIKLLDFGLARKVAGPTAAPYIPIEKIAASAEGTPEYMSPEQLHGSQMDQRGDLYSVGVILYELLTGRRPFESKNLEDLLTAHAEQPPPSFAQMGAAGIPLKIEVVVQACLAKKPDKRPQSARELVCRFEEATGQKLWYEEIYRSMLSPGGDSAAESEESSSPAAASAGQPGDNVFQLEAWMPESIAVMKLRGFLGDIGGEVTESVPGMIRVYLKRPRARSDAQAPCGGILSWFGVGKKAEAAELDLIEMEVHMKQHPSGKPNHLLITILLRVSNGPQPHDWQPWCDKKIIDLGAYLMAKRVE